MELAGYILKNVIVNASADNFYHSLCHANLKNICRKQHQTSLLKIQILSVKTKKLNILQYNDNIQCLNMI